MKRHSTIFALALIASGLGLASCGQTSSEQTSVPQTTSVLSFKASEDGKSYQVTGVSDTKVTEITVPETYKNLPVTSIAAGAFQKATKLESLTIPNTIESLEKGALTGCGTLKKLSLPFTGQKADAAAAKSCFGYAFGQTEFTGSSEITQQFSEAAEDNDTYYLPTSLKEVTFTGKSIAPYAFSNCSFISDFIVGKNAVTIGDKAFLSNALIYVYIENNIISSQLLGTTSCGMILANTPAVCLGAKVDNVSKFVAHMDTKDAWEHDGDNYTIYANNKGYRFEAEKSQYTGGVSAVECETGANGVPTSGGYYLGGFYPNGGTGKVEMEYDITSSKECDVSFIYCCGARATHGFKSCYRLTLNGTVVVPENDVDLSTPVGVAFQWTQWTRFSIMNIHLKKGANTFNMHFTPDGKETATAFSNDMYVDYIEFDTNAILSWTD
jgi:hypothetical protein